MTNAPNSKPVILVTRNLPLAVEQRLARDYNARFNPEDRLYDSAAVLGLSEGCDAILTCSTEKFPAAQIAALPASVKMLATFSVGHDHIDLEAARRRGLVVTNTPDVLTDATADIAILLLLGAARRASEGERMVRTGAWDIWRPTAMLGVHVTGKRLGIFGMGRIGQAVAKRARGFDMTIHYANRKRLPPALEAGAIHHADPDSMLPNCDFLSINAPSSPETRQWLDARRIALLPDGAIIVNTARGDLVDDDALVAALESGKLASAGLDVFTGEPRNIHPRYRTMEKIFVLPHMGSATRETRDAMGFRALENLDAFFSGRMPPDRLA